MADIDLRKLRYFVAVPELLLVLAPPLLEPLLEQAANATRAATEPTAPNVRSLNGRERVAVSPVPWNVPPPAVRIKNFDFAERPLILVLAHGRAPRASRRAG